MVLARAFQAVSGTAVGAGAGCSSRIKVVTYNLLADKYAMSGMHSYCPKHLLAWTKRSAMIQAEIESYDSDLLCLQEVDEGVFKSELKPWMDGRGFTGLYAVRQSREYPNPEGVALFWRRATFRHLADRYDPLAKDLQAVLGDSSRVSGKGLEFWNACAQREEVALLVLLEHLPTKRQVLATAVHLFWNPTFPDVKAVQAALMCHQISAFLKEKCGTLDVPVVVGGDFNSLPKKWLSDSFDKVPEGGCLTSGVYELLSTGQLAGGQQDHPFTRRGLGTPGVEGSWAAAPLEGGPMHASGLKLASMFTTAHGREPILTTKTKHFAGCLDYIWSSPHWTVLETLALPYDEAAMALTDPMAVPFPPIPDENYPSDHLAMGCLLELNPRAPEPIPGVKASL